MTITIGVLSGAVVVLVILNIYQYLVQRAALRIAEILYVMAGNVRAKAQEVRRDGKDVEIRNKRNVVSARPRLPPRLTTEAKKPLSSTLLPVEEPSSL